MGKVYRKFTDRKEWVEKRSNVFGTCMNGEKIEKNVLKRVKVTKKNKKERNGSEKRTEKNVSATC
jgi:hypothetical protein